MAGTGVRCNAVPLMSHKACSRASEQQHRVYSVLQHLEVDVHELLALHWSRQGDIDALLQPPPQGFINVPGEVGGCQHHHLQQGFQRQFRVQTLNLASYWMQQP